MTRRFDAMASAKIFSGKPEEIPKNLSMIRYPALASLKYDGWRMFEHDGEVRLRSLKPPKNLNTQKVMRELFAASASIGVRGLDGEALPGDPWDPNAMQACTSAFNAHHTVTPFGFYVFDCFQNPNAPFVERLKYAHDAVERLREMGFDWVHPVEHMLVHNEAELFAYYDEIIAKGGEGVMGRDPRGPYKYGRSTMRESWLWALKPYVDDYAVIIGYEEMLENQNELTVNERGYAARAGFKENMVPKGTLGKFICQSPNFPKTFGVGMGVGLDFALRDRVWADRPGYLGDIIKYKYQLIGVKERPRQPKFMGLPHDSEIPAEDLARLLPIREQILTGR
jgi:ATP dependent DNA ligase-like protein/DNA ligase-like protein